MMHHAIYNRGRDDGVSEIVAEILEIDVSREQCRPFAITTVDDLEEERSIFGVLLLDPIEPYFVHEKDIGGGVVFQFLVKALISKACHQLGEHVGSGRIAAPIEVSASKEKQGLGEMAFSGAGVAGNDKALLATDKVQLCNLEDLCFVHAGLEGEVKVREELSLRKPRLLDSSLDPSFDPGVGLDGKEPFKKVGRRQCLLCGTSKLLVKDFLYSQKLQGLQMLSDPRQGVLGHRHSPL